MGSLTASLPNSHRGPIRTIEWEMLDKRKFYPYSMMSSFTVRCFLYPLTLVRTRLQVQHHNAIYSGTFDAFRKILQHEGVKGLYRGFWISCFQGKSVSANPLAIKTEGRTKSQITWDVTRTIYYRDGFRGFYRGYLASLANYVPSSAAWWTFYQLYQEILTTLPPLLPHTGTQCVAAVMSGCTTSIITNPMDLVRTRVQVQRRSIPETIRFLWATERLRIFSKGLTARMTSSSIYSLAIILGYESVKKMSVLPAYKDEVRW